MDDEEWEATRRSRVKELEAMVLQLERENKKLLNRVTESAEKYREEASSASKEMTKKEDVKLTHAQSADDLISLDGNMARMNEDEWLYVSPAKPPTPSQKQVTPSQWLSRGDMAEEGEPVLSLDEVRKDLSFQISNAETISPVTARKKKAGDVVSPLMSRRQPSHPTAKRYLNQVRERRLSPSPPPPESLTPPQRRLAREPPDHTGPGSDDDVPIVKWKKPVLPPDDPPSPEEAVPVVRWKRPVMPQEEPQLPAAEEAVPVVKWKKPVMPQEESAEAVPVVRWKKPTMPPDDPPPHREEAIPIVKWKKPVMPRDEPQAPTTEEAIPKIKWKKPVMPTDNQPSTSGSEEVPVINWKPPRQRNVPIKAITTTARSPPEGEEDEGQGYRQVSTLPRSRRSAGLAKGGMGSPSSVQHRPRHNSAERPHPHPAGSTSLRSRSPSPSGPHHSVQVNSRSPSPSSSPQIRHLSPKSYRKPHPQGSSPMSDAHTLQPPKQKLIKSPSAPSPKRVAPSSPGGSLGGRGRGVPPSASAPRRLAFPSTQQPGNRGRPIPSSPPASHRGQLNTTPESSPRGGPRTQNSPQSAPRRGVMQPGSPGSQIKPARHSAAPSPRQKHQSAKPQPSKQVQPVEEDWLEGCF